MNGGGWGRNGGVLSEFTVVSSFPSAGIIYFHFHDYFSSSTTLTYACIIQSDTAGQQQVTQIVNFEKMA